MADKLLGFGDGLTKTIRDMGDGTYAEVVASGSKAVAVAATFTPAATSHTGLDSVGGAKTFVVTNSSGKMVKIIGYTFSIDSTTPQTTLWRLFLYNATPAVVADDAAYAVVTADGAKFLGIIDIAATTDFTSTWQQSEANNLTKPIQLVTDTITAYLQNITTATLEAVAHKVTLIFEPMS